MKKKRVLSNIIMFFILISSLFSTSYAIEDTKPILVIKQGQKMPVLKAGEDVDLKITIENQNQWGASDVTITPDIENANDFPFDIDKLTADGYIRYIEGKKSETISFPFKVSKNAESKIYKIKFNIHANGFKGEVVDTSGNIFVKIENNYGKPIIGISDFSFDGGKLVSGKPIKTNFEIKNDADLKAKDIQVKLSGFKNDGITLYKSMDTRRISSLDGGKTASVNYTLLVNDDVEQGNQDLDAIITYKDEFGKDYKMESKIYLPVESSGSSSVDFDFQNLSYPESVRPEQDFVISFDLKNIGTKEAKEVTVKVESEENIISKSLSAKSLGRLTPNSSKHLEFVMSSKPKVEAKNYPINIKVEYKTGSKDSASLVASKYVGVYISKNSFGGEEPKVIIDNYNFGNDYVKAGKEFKLNMSFFNTNPSKNVQNIKVSLSSEGNVFSPIGSSNSFYINNIRSGQKINKSIKLKAKPDAEYKTHVINVDMEYEDEAGQKITAKEIIGVSVVQELKLTLGNLTIPPEVFQDSPTAISLEFYNTGKSIVRNLMVKAEGDFDFQDANSTYVGNLESGKEDSFDFTLIPKKTGENTGKIIFEYDNDLGEHYKVEKNFAFNVQEAMPPEEPVNPEQEPEKKKIDKKVYIGAGIFGIILIGSVVLYKRRKRKKMEEELELDE